MATTTQTKYGKGSNRSRIIPGLAALISIATAFFFAVEYLSKSPGPTWSFYRNDQETLPLHDPIQDWNTTAPFIIDSVQGLLKQWSNTYAPNGHSIIAGTLAPATTLYSATHSNGPLKKPTFFAFDAEMSVGIYGGFGQSDLHVCSTTRALNILYFDGQSASLTPAGTLDSQMAVLQGQVTLDPSYDTVYDEDQRAIDLCKLVADLGHVDGIVRMNAGFELLICDLEAAQIQELFITNITVPGSFEEDPDGLPHDPNRQPPNGFGNVFSEQGSYEWLRSAAWHYGHHSEGGPPESRVQLDLCRMVSFYDPELTSLTGHRKHSLAGNYTYENGWGIRRGHRLLAIDETDVARVRSWLKAMTKPASQTATCSNVNWQALVSTIQSHHGTRAKEIGYTLSWDSRTKSEAYAIVEKIHELTHAVLAPYIEYGVSLGTNHGVSPRNQTISRCASIYTLPIKSDELSRSEMLLYRSFDIVMLRLCEWEWQMLEWSEMRTTNFWGHEDGGDVSLAQLQEEIRRYKDSTQDTLAWIGWDLWSQCDRRCALNEICAIPTWPVIYAPGLPQGGIYAGTQPNLTEEGSREFWRPKCINRTDFDQGGGRGRDPIHQFPDVPAFQ